jgi:hypothetical protein
MDNVDVFIDNLTKNGEIPKQAEELERIGQKLSERDFGFTQEVILEVGFELYIISYMFGNAYEIAKLNKEVLTNK